MVFKLLILSGAYNYYNLNGAQIVTTLVVSNLYVYILMYIYSLDEKSQQDIERRNRERARDREYQKNYMYLEDVSKRDLQEEYSNFYQNNPAVDLEFDEAGEGVAAEREDPEGAQEAVGGVNRGPGSAFDALGGRREIDLEFDDEEQKEVDPFE